MSELAPGVIALLINLVEAYELNGLSVEVCYKLEANAESFYDPIEDEVFLFNEDDLNNEGDWWGCIVTNHNSFQFFRSKNLMPLGKKSQKEKDKEVEKDNELCKST